MRSLEETCKRWDVLFPEETIGVDLRQAVRDSTGSGPCQDGLRSICWKAFLLYGPVSLASWRKKLADSRSAYTSLREHFLKYIDHPDELQSTIDPLADDDNSPWNAFRKDELSREEIFQDIERCMQENYFFREPVTQKRLLDILFIYSKLNPDTGYRQGMHELLAPILWVVDCDAVENPRPGVESHRDEQDATQLICDALDPDYVEHDAFSLFCAVMQTAKSFYEVGDSKTSPLAARSSRIQGEVLAQIDAELEHQLNSIEILPQIYVIRWVRLLFGRDFAFDDVLLLWDALFAENLCLSTVDMVCIAMLLRIRWQLLQADYSAALTMLLHYELPPCVGGAATLVKDAMFLDRNRTAEAGATLIKQHTGRALLSETEQTSQLPPRRPPPSRNVIRDPLTGSARKNTTAVSNRLSASFQNQQRGLETLFSDVSSEVYRRTEGWTIAKAVKGAVTEVRRNVNSMQGGSPRSKAPSERHSLPEQEVIKGLTDRVHELETRNKVLAKMLDNALDTLRKEKASPETEVAAAEDVVNITLANIQFVQVYLADPDIPIPLVDTESPSARANEPLLLDEATADIKQAPPQAPPLSVADPVKPEHKQVPAKSDVHIYAKKKPQRRPALAESSFSFMLGEDRRRSSFVSQATEPPEKRRDSESKPMPKQVTAATKETAQGRRDSESEDDGFTMKSLRGFEKKGSA